MRPIYRNFKELLPEMSWSPAMLAEKLSLIGFETEAEGEHLNVTVPTNRPDCRDFNYLVFDLAACYGLSSKVRDVVKVEPRRTVNVSTDEINKLLGSAVSTEDYRSLERLGFIVGEDSVAVPHFRHDVSEAADVAEEVVRVLGYGIVRKKQLDKRTNHDNDRYHRIISLKVELATLFKRELQLGLTETITSTFTEDGALRLNNPSNQTEPFLRPSLLGGLLQTVARNPYLKTGGFFEVGDVYQPQRKTALGVCLFGLKDYREAEDLLKDKLGRSVKLEPIAADVCLANGVRQAKVVFGEVELNEIRPTLAGREWRLFTSRPLPKFKPISKFPPLLRDITVAAEPTRLEAILKQMADFQNRHEKELLIAELIDCYTPQGGTKNRYTLRLIFQNYRRSFTSDDIEMIERRIGQHFAEAA